MTPSRATRITAFARLADLPPSPQREALGSRFRVVLP